MNIKQENTLSPDIPNAKDQRIIDDRIYERIAHFLHQGNDHSENNRPGPCMIFDKKGDGLVKFLQVSKGARSASMPYIWKSFVVRNSNDFFYAFKIFKFCCTDIQTFRNLYGKYVKTLAIWISEVDDDVRKTKRARISNDQSSAPGDYALSYHNLMQVLCTLVKTFPNLERIDFRFGQHAISKELAEAIEESCLLLTKMYIHTDALDDGFDGTLPSLRNTLKSLFFETKQPFDLKNFSLALQVDEKAPFGFRMCKTGRIYTKDQVAAIRIIDLCKVGIQHKVKKIILPYVVEFFLEKRLWPIWIWSNLSCFSKRREGKAFLFYSGWTRAFKELRKMIDSPNPPQTPSQIKERRSTYLSQNRVASILAEGYLFALHSRSQAGVDDEMVMKHYSINVMLHIFTTLERDESLLKAILKAKNEVGKFSS